MYRSDNNEAQASNKKQCKREYRIQRAGNTHSLQAPVGLSWTHLKIFFETRSSALEPKRSEYNYTGEKLMSFTFGIHMKILAAPRMMLHEPTGHMSNKSIRTDRETDD